MYFIVLLPVLLLTSFLFDHYSGPEVVSKDLIQEKRGVIVFSKCKYYKVHEHLHVQIRSPENTIWSEYLIDKCNETLSKEVINGHVVITKYKNYNLSVHVNGIELKNMKETIDSIENDNNSKDFTLFLFALSLCGSVLVLSNMGFFRFLMETFISQK